MDKIKEFITSVTANWGRKEYILAAVAVVVVIILLAQ